MMKKLDMVKINRSNSDIWGQMQIALKSGNIAVIERALGRMYALQKYYLDLLNFQDMEINQLKDHLATEQKTTESFEKEWLLSLTKNSPQYDSLKERIESQYKNI